MAVAAESDVELLLTPDSHLDAPESSAQTLMTIIGNLVDNALEAVADQAGPRRVTVALRDEDEVVIAVTDTGPGIHADAVEEIFTDGFSTKTPRGGMRRGLGLALVRRLVRRAGGQITSRGRAQVRGAVAVAGRDRAMSIKCPRPTWPTCSTAR